MLAELIEWLAGVIQTMKDLTALGDLLYRNRYRCTFVVNLVVSLNRGSNVFGKIAKCSRNFRAIRLIKKAWKILILEYEEVSTVIGRTIQWLIYYYFNAVKAFVPQLFV